MQHLDLNQFLTDVHRNAVAHGWWDKPRDDFAIRALFHCELSEAVESYRSGLPAYYHHCPNNPAKSCEDQDVHDMDCHCEACTTQNRKPDGESVELMDFVIRVMDYLGSVYFVLPKSMDTAAKLAAWAVDDIRIEDVDDVLALDLPALADVLHTHVALSNVKHNVTYLTTACGVAMAWVERRGMDPVTILTDKHHFNKTRPYRHGGKVC